MKLTQKQLDVLNHIVVDGQAWADNATKEAHVLAKVAKYESAYDEAVAKGNYQTRKQREDAGEQKIQDEYDNASYDVKRSREYAPISDQLDYIYHNGIEKWKADMVLPVKEKYPKGVE
jgi:hypothetical protein